jgi:hypothetical protein
MILDNLVGIARRCERAGQVVAAVRAHFSTGKTSTFILGKIQDDYLSFLQNISVMVTADLLGGPPRLLGEEGGYQSFYSSIPSASSFFDIIFPASFFLSENRPDFDVQGEVVPYFSALATFSSLGSFGNCREKRGLFQTSSFPFISNVRFSGNNSIFSSASPWHLSFLFTVSSFGNSGNLLGRHPDLVNLETASLGRHGEGGGDQFFSSSNSYSFGSLSSSFLFFDEALQGCNTKMAVVPYSLATGSSSGVGGDSPEDDDAAILTILPFGQFGISHYPIPQLELSLYCKPPSSEAFYQTQTAETAETAKTRVMANLPWWEMSFHLLNLSPYVTETSETAKIKELHYQFNAVHV